MAPKAVPFTNHGVKLFQKLSSLYPSKVQEAPRPLTSEGIAIIISVVFTLLYIAPFYLSPTLRATPLNGRDAPSVIQARIRAVIVTCISCAIITGFVLFEFGHCSVSDILHLTGIWPAHAVDSFRVLALAAVLFIGPLYERILVEGNWRHISLASVTDTLWTSSVTHRNLVIAPISEELVFRSFVIPFYLLARVDPTRIVFVSPLIFGLAHIHHLIEFLGAHTLPGHRLPPTQYLVKGIVRSLFQFTYTSLFGFFATFVFLRTGSVWATIVAHVFCNWMGFPRVWGKLSSRKRLVQDITPDVAQGKKDEDSNGVVKVGTAAMINDGPATPVTAQTSSLFVSIIYYLLLVVGAVGFQRLLWQLTGSDNELAVFV